MSYFNVTKLESKVKRLARWPLCALHGETTLPSVIGQIPEMRSRYLLSL